MSAAASLSKHLRLRTSPVAAALGRVQQVAVWHTAAASRGQQHPPAIARPAVLSNSISTSSTTSSSSAWRRLSGCRLPSCLLPRQGRACAGGGGAARGVPSGRRGMSSNPLDGMDVFGGDGGDLRTVVESYTPEGFIINQTFVEGATILLPEMVLHWNVREMHDLTWESISIVRLLSKKPEILLLGTGRRIQRLPDAVQVQVRRMGLNVEVMDSVNAVATFNVLNQEGRQVVAALLPLETVREEKVDEEEDILKDMPRPQMKAPPSERAGGPKKKGLSAGGGRPGGEARPGDPRF